MKCPYCRSKILKTLETRDSLNNVARRRRECADCGKRFTAYEYVEVVEIVVKKKDVSVEQIRLLAEQVRQELTLKDKEEVSSREIGNVVMKHLKKLDRVAYVRFASVYRNFEEPADFARVLQEVKE